MKPSSFVIDILHVSGCPFLRVKNRYRQDQINFHGSWQYIKVLWSITVRLCKEMKIIYINTTFNPLPGQTVLSTLTTVCSTNFLSHDNVSMGTNSNINWCCLLTMEREDSCADHHQRYQCVKGTMNDFNVKEDDMEFYAQHFLFKPKYSDLEHTWAYAVCLQWGFPYNGYFSVCLMQKAHCTCVYSCSFTSLFWSGSLYVIEMCSDILNVSSCLTFLFDGLINY